MSSSGGVEGSEESERKPIIMPRGWLSTMLWVLCGADVVSRSLGLSVQSQQGGGNKNLG